MSGVVVDGVGGFDEGGVSRGGFAGVEVAVEAREVAAGYFEANDVAFEEDVAGGPEVDFVFVDFAWLEEFCWACGGFAIAGAQDSLGEILHVAIGPDVDEFCGEVGVDGGGGGVEIEGDRAGDFDVSFERRRGVDEDVGAGFHFFLIARAGGQMRADRSRVGRLRWERGWRGRR